MRSADKAPKPSRKGVSPQAKLWKAIAADDLLALRSAVAEGADVHARSTNDAEWSVLACAAYSGSPEMIRELIRLGASPDDGGPQTTPLIIAVQNCKLAAVQTLLEAGADPNRSDSNHGRTPLMFAARGNGLPTFDIVAPLRLLLDRGADPNLTDTDGQVALDIARAHAPNERSLLDFTRPPYSERFAQLLAILESATSTRQ